MEVNVLGAELARVRLAGTRLSDYPCAPPVDLNQAYLVQDVMAASMGSAVVGWKIGVTSEVARKMLGLDDPLSGPLFDDFALQSPARLNVTPNDLRVVEVEIGIRMKHSLEPRNTPYSKEEVAAGIATVHPVFEVVNKRLPGDLKDNVCWLVADGGVDHAFIYGQGIDYDTSMDLAAETATVMLDGEYATDGVGANAMGDPLNVLVWLANHLSARNIPLNAGDWISTGLIADIVIVEQGSTIVAAFKNLGSVSLEFTS